MIQAAESEVFRSANPAMTGSFFDGLDATEEISRSLKKTQGGWLKRIPEILYPPKITWRL